ncbi:MAG: hypothetical protein WKF37_01605 [Bryobacteraceae bacterium]
MRPSASIVCFVLAAGTLPGQQYDLLLTRGHVIDPKNGVNAVKDVAISNGKVAAVADRIDPSRAFKTVDVSGLYVAPGFIDIHAHFWGTPAQFFILTATRCGPVITAVDAGGSGWRTFPAFRKKSIEPALVRCLRG